MAPPPSGIFTQESVQVLYTVNDGSGYITQQGLEILYRETPTNQRVTQALVQVAASFPSPATASGFFTQESVAVLHAVDDGSGYITQQALELLYTETPPPEGPPSGFFTQESVAVLHAVDDGSGYITQQGLEILYRDSTAVATRQLATQALAQIAVGTGVIPLLPSGLVTQDVLEVLHGTDSASGRFTQDYMEVLYVEQTGAQGLVTQDTLEVLHNVDSASGRLTQDYIEVLHNQIGVAGRNTQQALSVLHNVDSASGRFTQNVMEILYNATDARQVTQTTLEVLHDADAASGRFTQDLIEVLYSPLQQVGNVTQDTLEVLHDVNEASGRFTQDYVEVLYNTSEIQPAIFKIPTENLQFVKTSVSAIALLLAKLEGKNATGDFTEEAKDNTPDDVRLLADVAREEDTFLVLGSNTYEKIQFDITTPADWTGQLTWEYLRNDQTWQPIPNVKDDTDSFENSGIRSVVWSKLDDMGQISGGFGVRGRQPYTPLTTQAAFARRIDLFTASDGDGDFPIEFTPPDKQQKQIEVDCGDCAIDCCGPCCCGCIDISGGNMYFKLTWPDCNFRELLTEDFVATGIDLEGIMQATGLPDSEEDCYSRLGITTDEDPNPQTVFVWSGDLCTPTDDNDCWRLTWGCNIKDSIADTMATGCEAYELLIEVLKCSGSIFTPCDNGDNLEDVDLAGGSSAYAPTDVGFLSGCSCDPFMAVYTGICFNSYACRCCDNSGTQSCFNIEIMANPF